MQRLYALAELHWPVDLKQGPAGGRLCTPAHFEGSDRGDWSLFVWLDQPAQPGDRVTVPVTPLISESAEALLRPEAVFRLFVGHGLFATGRVLWVVPATQHELKSVFHFC